MNYDYRKFATKWALKFPTHDALSLAIAQRLFDVHANTENIGHREDEMPEDVVIALLDNDIPLVKHAVAKGWVLALEEAECQIQGAHNDILSLNKAFRRIFSVAELTGCSLIRYDVWKWFARIEDNIPDLWNWQQNVAAAALSFPIRENHLSLWLQLLDNAEVASYAFRAILKANLSNEAIATHLFTLFKRQYQEGWKIDCWFLLEYVKNDEVYNELFTQIINDKELSEKVWHDLARIMI